MAEFTIHTLESAPEAVKPALRAAKQKFGFLPNLLGELAAAPAAAEAYLALGRFLEQTSFRPPEQQLLLTAVSVANGCQYCVAAHSAGLRMTGMAQDQIDAVRQGRALADSRLEALRTFVTAVVEQRGRVSDDTLQGFFDAGYQQAQVFEVLLAVAMKTLSNYVNHIAATPLDEQFKGFAWEPAEASATPGR
ncbi:MAG: carboxymuconolactone decarboxylase family protein [Gemmatimonadetes bacterium]|nr:carboxymuconolactone decarboxylase family protein [Gemmatimonadota bacterium]